LKEPGRFMANNIEIENGIYENSYGIRLKVSGKKPHRGWGEDVTVGVKMLLL
jgi:hypothetical protein